MGKNISRKKKSVISKPKRYKGFRHKAYVILGADDIAPGLLEGGVLTQLYPRSVGRKVLFLGEKARVTVSGSGRAIYLRLPIIFQTPGPFYSIGMSAFKLRYYSIEMSAFKLRYRIDDRPWQEIVQYAVSEVVVLAEDLPLGRHTVIVEPTVGARCAVAGFCFAPQPLTSIRGIITTYNYSELLVDVRADIFKDDKIIRTDYVRSPHSGRFSIIGLAPGRYCLRLTAAGWKAQVIDQVSLDGSGCKVDLGVIVLEREPACEARENMAAIGHGKSANTLPGGLFETIIPLWAGPQKKALLISRFKTINLNVKEIRKLEFRRWNACGVASFQVPAGIPFDMYDLKLIYESGTHAVTQVLGQAVCVREMLPADFYVAGCGHMNTWGQQPSEYLARVAEMAQLAGARMLLIANEVNAAYVCGALRNLRIPYVVTAGNHTMARWENFFGPKNLAYDDGTMRVVTFSGPPYDSWNEAADLIGARPEVTNRILLCFEGFAPLSLIRDKKVSLLFDGHSDSLHPDRAAFPKGTMQFRAPNQESLRWIPMTRAGLRPSVRTPKDVPVLQIDRDRPSPLRVEFTGDNNGSASELTARIINEFKIPFPDASLRLILKKGKYLVAGGTVQQTFDSDDGRFSVLDICASVGPKQTIIITARPDATVGSSS
ncbi:MAG: carboxypeptidase-like regulatory domain-containing protein [Kiritimatiellia bacterium]|nr:carboxypeptidase-like regulatory domain-containing protein [Kiritimatiellia bacterium]